MLDEISPREEAAPTTSRPWWALALLFVTLPRPLMAVAGRRVDEPAHDV